MNHPIDIQVKTQYLADQSVPADDRFVFSYTITVTNRGSERAQLISRHWVITDGNDAVQEVKGTGVVGQQPTLEPGASYTYSSGVVLATETGTMTGSYQMRLSSGDEFDAPIPEFALVPPHLLH
ncbi:MAG: Co2+/Mg2+ efflux protein ApaG [Cellvibrionaceae bacterium]|nr:Co2+/Mg2+ efflux protein ApaG [Cellvibrionaceae bacterium]